MICAISMLFYVEKKMLWVNFYSSKKELNQY